MAKEGNNEGCKILAKQLVQLRAQKNRIYSANSKVSPIATVGSTVVCNCVVVLCCIVLLLVIAHLPLHGSCKIRHLVVLVS